MTTSSRRTHQVRRGVYEAIVTVTLLVQCLTYVFGLYGTGSLTIVIILLWIALMVKR